MHNAAVKFSKWITTENIIYKKKIEILWYVDALPIYISKTLFLTTPQSSKKNG